MRGADFTVSVQGRKPRVRKLKSLAQDHTASDW